MLGFICLLTKTGLSQSADSTTMLFDITIASNPYLKGFNSASVIAFTIYNNTLFVINKDKSIEINLQNGTISPNKVVTDFIKKLPKDRNYVSQIKVTEDGYYVTVFFDLYHIAKNGMVKKVYTMSRFISDVYVANDQLIVGNIDSVVLIGKDGKLQKTWSFPSMGVNGYIKAETDLYYTANGEDSTLEFQSNNANGLSVHSYPPVSELKKIKEPYLAYVSDKYFIVFPYAGRNIIYAVKKDMNKLEVYKAVKVKGVNLTATLAQMQEEEGDPNIKVGYDNNVYYILSVIKGKLKILSFTI